MNGLTEANIYIFDQISFGNNFTYALNCFDLFCYLNTCSSCHLHKVKAMILVLFTNEELKPIYLSGHCLANSL